MSRREEIKEKEVFQLKFQSAIAHNNEMARKWLSNGGTTVPKDGSKNGSEQGTRANKDNQFLNLPVISPGKSLGTSKETIGTYLNGKPRDTVSSRTPMNSLMNKMRNSQRQVVKQGSSLKQGGSRPVNSRGSGSGRPVERKGQAKGQANRQGNGPPNRQGSGRAQNVIERDSDSDSDSDSEGRIIGKAKKPKLLF